MFRRILTAIDDVDADRGALQLTAELARSSGATVRLLHLDATDVVGIGIVDLDDPRSGDELIDRAVRVVASPDVHVEAQAVQALSGDVPDLIARSADEFGADLVVLAPHRRSRLQALLFPRVSDALAHSLQTPLLLVPAAQYGPREDATTSDPRNGQETAPRHRFTPGQKDTL
jgi:nucleotide-binding universal stress UspA family protein